MSVCEVESVFDSRLLNDVDMTLLLVLLSMEDWVKLDETSIDLDSKGVLVRVVGRKLPI